MYTTDAGGFCHHPPNHFTSLMPSTPPVSVYRATPRCWSRCRGTGAMPMAIVWSLVDSRFLPVRHALPRGDITVQFRTAPGPAPKPFAVTGGTGRYRNVRGQGLLVESGQETATLSFDLIGVHDDD